VDGDACQVQHLSPYVSRKPARLGDECRGGDARDVHSRHSGSGAVRKAEFLARGDDAAMSYPHSP